MEKREWTNFIDELKRRSDMVDVVSQYAVVQQKGRRFWARCPIHNEKTPSFSINREAQTFYCFGCHAGGDVIKFVEDIEGIGFMEAVEHLAKRANLPMPSSSLTDDDIIKAKKTKERYYAVCLEAAKHYNANLKSNSGAAARDYLSKRGITESTATTFGLGLSLGFDALPEHLKNKGIGVSDAVKAGVLMENKKGGYYDALFGRLIVPIINVSNQVVAFGGRILEKRDDVAKYKNTSETPIFEKSKNLFGINIVKKQKTTQRVENIVIVEGYMDVIALYQAGLRNCVASMGTALTKEQARLVKRYTDTVYISYDGDSAGQAATVRGLDILRDEGLDVYVVTIPDGLDPDEYVRLKGVDEYRRLLGGALPLVAYKLNLLKHQYDINSDNEIKRDESRRKYVSAALKILSGLQPVEKESYINAISLETGFAKEFLDRTITENKDIKTEIPSQPSKNAKTKVTAEIRALCFVAKAALNAFPWAKLTEKPFCYGNGSLENLFDYVFDCEKTDKKPIPSMAYQLADDEAIISLVVEDETFGIEASKEYFDECLLYLKKIELKSKLAKAANDYNAESDKKQKEKLLNDITRLTNQIKNIKDVAITEDK